MRASRTEATSLVGHTFWVVCGQVGSAVLGLVAALLVPRVLLPADFGEWILLRGYMALFITLTLMGTPEIMARFYVARQAEGRPTDAGHILKLVVIVRAVLMAPALMGFAWLAHGHLRLPNGSADLLCLSVGMAAQGGVSIFSLLLYAHRQFRRLAVFHAVQPALVPLLVASAHTLWGYKGVPLAVAVGDTAGLLLVVALSLRWWHWPAGWLSRAECRGLLRFGATVGAAGTAAIAFPTVVPGAMAAANYDVRAIGYLGIAARLSGFVNGAIGAVGSGLFPTMTRVLHFDGESRMLRWLNLATRLGLLLSIAVAGLFALNARWLVPLLLGGAYAESVPAMVLGVYGIVPAWLAGQMIQLALLVERPAAQMLGVLALYAAFASALWWLPVDGLGTAAALAILAGKAAQAGATMLLLARHIAWRATCRQWGVPLIALAVAPALAASAPAGIGAALGLSAAWVLGLGACTVVARVLARHEIADLLSVMRAARRGNAPEP